MASHAHRDPAVIDLRLLQGMRWTAYATSTIAIAVGVLVLLGWACNIHVLRSIVPGLTAMNPGGTAITFLLAGISLALAVDPQDKSRLQGSQWLALIVIILATSRLVCYLLQWDVGPDQWLFHEKLNAYTPVNRMAPNTALGMLLVGTALLMLDVETRRIHRPAQWLTLVAALIAMFTIVGYAYNSSS
ncbi:MAG: hypothetical protein V4719_03640, partial [Planctomycetota bacterium]